MIDPRALALLALCTAFLLPTLASAGPKYAPPTPEKVAAGLHDGHAVAPSLRWDGQWIAYGVEETRPDVMRSRYYARSLGEDATFRSVWPSQHPSFEGNEGTASFTDLIGFVWHPEGRTNAMVVRHKTKGAEVMLELLKVRFGGPGEQNQPVFSTDGKQAVVVAQGELGRELWVAKTEHDAELEQLTFTRDDERWPVWSPDGKHILHEIRNKKTGTSDLFLFDLEYYDQQPFLRLEGSDEIHPTYSPDGGRIAFLSNKDDPAGKRYDLLVGLKDGSNLKTLIQGVRTTERSRGYHWDPQGRFVIAVQDDLKAGHPLVAVRADGEGKPKSLGISTTDNADPHFVLLHAGGDWPTHMRLCWTAANPTAHTAWRTTYRADVEIAQLLALLGLE